MYSVQVVEDFGKDGPMHVYFMQSQVIDLDCIDTVSHMRLHPPAHFAVARVGKVLDVAADLWSVVHVVRRVVQQQRGDLEEMEWNVM